jgi:membrane protein
MKLPVKLPEHLMVGEVDVIVVGKRLIAEIGEDDVSGAAAELAYRLFLALFPFFIFLTALGGFASDALGIDDPSQRVMEELGQQLPPDAASLLQREIETVIESRDAGLVSIGILGAIWAASSGVGTIMKAMNRAYEVKETRSRWKRYGLAVGLTLLGGLFMIGGTLLLLGGQWFGLEVAERLGFEGTAATAFALMRWPLVLVCLMAALAFLYWAAPNVQLPFKWITPGAVLATFAWVVMTLGFGVYVANFGSYNATYGALAGVVIALFYLYLTSFVLLAGAELNAILAQESAPEKLPEAAGAAMTADTVPDHRKSEAMARAPTAAVATAVQAAANAKSQERAARRAEDVIAGPAAAAEAQSGGDPEPMHRAQAEITSQELPPAPMEPEAKPRRPSGVITLAMGAVVAVLALLRLLDRPHKKSPAQ